MLLHISSPEAFIDLHTFVVILHILGAGAVVGSTLALLAVLLNVRPFLQHIRVLSVIEQTAIYGIFWQLLTGIHMALGQFATLGVNPLFWVKMGVFLFEAGIVVFLIRQRIEKMELNPSGPELQLRPWAWIAVVCSVLLTSFGVLLFR